MDREMLCGIRSFLRLAFRQGKFDVIHTKVFTSMCIMGIEITILIMLGKLGLDICTLYSFLVAYK